ncbi:SAPS-domain-containing protein [Pholiota conissans]|uniref:SAPS-domain-containing protein n=1 Tax=Pholiota conissans TaxID=109636 RepID=A0A9P5Z0L7_9AGAR|nr:SAPS-domain-containing protein [Pholiota conissans]
MFWRFGFHNGSAIDSLLDKENVTLEAILDEDDLLQECKAQNTRLIDYFERVDVLQKLFGYVTGQIESEEKGQFKYPYIATEVLCSEIWSIIDTCLKNEKQLLVPFWETVLDRSADDMKTQMTMASHFAKINSVFLTKKPSEMLAFIQSQPHVVERILRHIETPSFVDLLSRIIQLDETIPNCNVLEWLSSENLMGRLLDLLSPNYTPSVHTVVTDLVKSIISMATPSPGVGLTEGLQNGPASNRFARELATKENVTKLANYMLSDFAPDTCNTPTEETISEEEDGRLSSPTFESSTSSVVQSIAVIIELIRKNNSDYFEPYLFHTLRNRLIQVQQQSQLSGEDIRTALEQVMQEMVHRMGVVHLGPVLEVMSERLQDFQKYLKKPRSLQGDMSTTIGKMTPFTLERYRIVELYAELLHCSNMSLLNRPASFSHMYDMEGRLQGGLAGLEELAQVIALNNSNEQGTESMDEGTDEVNHTLEFPVRNPSDSSPSLDSDESMSDSADEPGSSDDEAMEEIAMDEPLSPIPFAQPLPQVSAGVASSPENLVGSPDSRDEISPVSIQTHGSSPDSQSSGMTSRTSGSGRGSRRSSRSRRRPTLESSRESLLPIGEQLKLCLLNENVLSTLIDMFFAFPWNNFLHSAVYDVVHQVMTGAVDGGYNRELIISLFRDAKILHRIVEGQSKNDVESSKPKGVRLGYMGHLMLISEDVITAMARFPPDLRLAIIQYAPEPEWDQYVTGRYNETKKEDSRLLGGGKPVIKSNRNIGQWKVDEDDMMSDTVVGSSNSGDTVRGEFKRATSVEPSSIKQTADFGPAMSMDDDDDDDDNISSNRAPHFARYLAQEMASSDNFGSSDEDEEDEGWLTQSTFGMNPIPPRPFGERRPLSNSSFDDAFNPSSAAALAMAEDPFSPHDDDGFGPFSDSHSAAGDGFAFSSSFSDEDSSFESFGDFGDFQSAEDGESTPTTSGSWTFASGMEDAGNAASSSSVPTSSTSTSATVKGNPK